MSQVDKLQDAEEAVNQQREEAARAERELREADLRRAPLADTAAKAHTTVIAALAQVRVMVNMRSGPLPDLHELAVSIKEAGLLHPPLVRATGDAQQPYELLAGRRRFAAMGLLEEAEGPRDGWRFTLVEGVSRREALTMQFAENFHQSKPEPVQFARAARAIMAEDDRLTAADVSRLVGAPLAWTRQALRLLDLPPEIVQRVEQGDLSFTVAELVRRGIARGDISAEAAAALVAQHAEGEITGGALKLGVGYVPPRPKDYDEQSRKLDQARWQQARNSDAGAGDALQRDGDARSAPRSLTARVDGGADAPWRESAPEVRGEELDAYLLGLVLGRLAGDELRGALRIDDQDAAYDYAFSVAPPERLGVLRTVASELLSADGAPPPRLRR